MSKRPILPSSADIINPAIAALIAARPRAFEAINLGQGVYSHIFEGLRAQADLCIARLADGVKGNTKEIATGAQLQAFIASEFELPSFIGPTTAFGTITLDRTASTAPKIAGVIPKGRRLRRDPITDGTVPLVQADYQVAQDTQVILGQNTVDVPIIATREGSSSNTPNVLGVTFPSLVVVDSLFDKNLLPTTYDMGGGSDGFNDADVLRYGRAFAAGQYGPTDQAFVLSALRAGGVRHIIVSGNNVYVADPSWGGSAKWAEAVKHAMLDSDAMGYATRFTTAVVPSYPVVVNLTVRLRSATFLSNTAAITDEITSAVRSYFDDRDDFNTVVIPALRAAVSRVDTQVLRCTDATLLNPDGSPFSLPAIGHAYLAHNAANITYLPPV